MAEVLAGPVTGLAATDVERARGLRRMKLVALSLLGFAAVVFLATLRLDHSGFWGYVNTASEAAMVGALADWFAVTALFRRPLGLPIPHTAIVPTRKDEIGRNLQSFFTENFLTESVVRDRIEQADVARRVGAWLQQPQHARRVTGELAVAGRRALERIDDADVRAVVVDGLLPRLAEEPVAPVAGDLLDGLVRDGAHQPLVELLFTELHDWLAANPDKFATIIEDRAPSWAPTWVNEQVVLWTHRQAMIWVDAMRSDPLHPTRRAIDDLLLSLARDLRHDATVQERTEELKARLLTHPQTGDTVLSLWRSLRTSVLAALDDSQSGLWTRGEGWLRELGTNLVENDAVRTVADARIADGVVYFSATYGDELSQVISHTIEQWDGQEASRRIELHVGRDLQFIRINGTVVGALAGIAIHAVAQLLG